MGLKTLNNFTDYLTVNERIAFILGYRKVIGMTENGKVSQFVQWSYPKDYPLEIYCRPVGDIPDFVSIINNAFVLHKLYRSIPKESTNKGIL